MPGQGVDIWQNIWTVINEPVFDGWYRAFGEYFREKRSPNIEDESLGAFIERRAGGRQIADNIVSAVIHGIYAGDVWQLSAKSLLRKTWWLEEKFGSITMAMSSLLNDKVDWIPEKDLELVKELTDKLPQELRSTMGGASVYTFKKGIGQFATSIENYLENKSNVRVLLNKKVKSLTYIEDGDTIKVGAIVLRENNA